MGVAGRAGSPPPIIKINKNQYKSKVLFPANKNPGYAHWCCFDFLQTLSAECIYQQYRSPCHSFLGFTLIAIVFSVVERKDTNLTKHSSLLLVYSKGKLGDIVV